jgi:uncharacterized membrane protein
MNKLAYIYAQNEFVVGQVVLKLMIKRLAVAIVNKTVVYFGLTIQSVCLGVCEPWVQIKLLIVTTTWVYY